MALINFTGKWGKGRERGGREGGRGKRRGEWGREKGKGERGRGKEEGEVGGFLLILIDFFSGFLPTFLGILPYAGTSFMTYGTMKSFFRFVVVVVVVVVLLLLLLLLFLGVNILLYLNSPPTEPTTPKL